MFSIVLYTDANSAAAMHDDKLVSQLGVVILLAELPPVS